jgi:hypothetical protein
MVLGGAHGGDARAKGARFPQVKNLDDFDFSFQLSVKRQIMAHVAQLDFLREATNVIFLGFVVALPKNARVRSRTPRAMAVIRFLPAALAP